MGEMDGKTALVTGGGTGIGFGIARVLLREGADVTLAARREDVLAEAVSTFEEEGYAGRIAKVGCDVTNEAQVEAAVAAASRDGRLDVLVNNAGSGLPGTIMQMSADAWRFSSEINIVGPALCMKHAAHKMRDQGGGSIVNISSVSATHYQPWLIGYNTTKAGQDMLTRGAAVELAQHKIRVNAVAPGFVEVSEIMKPVEKGYTQITPAGRVGQPEDIAEAVLYFASDRSAWTTGQILAVDGGVSVPLMLDMGPLAELLYGSETVKEFGVKDYRRPPDD